MIADEILGNPAGGSGRIEAPRLAYSTTTTARGNAYFPPSAEDWVWCRATANAWTRRLAAAPPCR